MLNYIVDPFANLLIIFIAAFVVAVINVILLWNVYEYLKKNDHLLWEKLGEPSIFRPSIGSNMKILRYLFNTDPKPISAHILRYTFILFSLLFACYILFFVFY